MFYLLQRRVTERPGDIETWEDYSTYNQDQWQTKYNNDAIHWQYITPDKCYSLIRTPEGSQALIDHFYEPQSNTVWRVIRVHR